MSHAVSPSDAPFADLLSRLPATLDLDGLALETKAIQRRRGLRSGADLLRLGLAWGPGERSLQEVAAWSGLLGFAQVSDAALIQRLHKAVTFFEAITTHLLRAAAGTLSWTGRRLRICDASSLSGPASQGTDWRIHGVYDLGARRFSHLEVTDRYGGEALDRGAPIAGEIRMADRGYAIAKARHRFRAAGGPDGDFIVRMRWNTVSLRDETGNAFDLIGWLKGLAGGAMVHERPVTVVAPGGQPPLTLRLIAHRKSPEAVARGRRPNAQASASAGRPQAEQARPPQRGGSRVRPAGDLPARRRLSCSRGPGGLPPALADRVGLQAIEVASACRQAAHPHASRHAMLAAHPPDPGPALRGPKPGSPGRFPLRTSLRRDRRPPCGACTASSTG